MKHVLITGQPGVGKSTLIRRVLEALHRPVAGYYTKKEPALADAALGDPIFIHRAGEPWRYEEENKVGYCKDCHTTMLPGSFDRFAPDLLLPVPENGVLVFDELGTLEAKETKFCDAIRTRLEGTIPIIAAVKQKDRPFLNEIRSHPNCTCFFITEENRETLFLEVLAYVKAQWQ